ncbi:MAG: hypothetical protein QM484_06720 [Woeseiaceae bacterium]
MTTDEYREISDEWLNFQLQAYDGEFASTIKASLYYRLLAELFNKIIIYAAVDNCSKYEFENYLSLAIEVITTLQYGLKDPNKLDDTDSNETVNKIYNFWSHDKHLLYKIKRNKESPYISREEIEDAATYYIGLPIRSSALERLLIDILIAMELSAFTDEMCNEQLFPGLPPRSPLSVGNPFFIVVKSLFFDAVIWLGLAAIFIYAGSKSWVSDDLAFYIAITLALFFVLGSLYKILRLPFLWKEINKSKTKVLDLIDSMDFLYTELNSNSLISAKHILKGAEKAVDKGVVWPTSLFVLLDDIIERDGYF